jgi:hypothetical protein
MPGDRPLLRTATVLEANTRAASIVVWAVGLPSLLLAGLGLLPGGSITIIAMLVVLVGSLLLVGIARTHSRRFLVAHNFRLCELCRYPLHDLGAHGTCPECGGNFNVEAAEAYWTAVYRDPDWPPAD